MAITKTDLYWGKGELETLRLSDLARVPLAQISGASLDYDLVQLEISGELMVIRPHSWNRYEGDVDRSLEVLALLSEIDVPFFAVTPVVPRSGRVSFVFGHRPVWRGFAGSRDRAGSGGSGRRELGPARRQGRRTAHASLRATCAGAGASVAGRFAHVRSGHRCFSAKRIRTFRQN